MFLYQETCLLCGKTKTPVREHWCELILQFVILASIDRFGSNINTGLLTSFLTNNEEPLKMSRSRACAGIKKLENSNIIKVPADPIDPRKNVAWVEDVERLSRLKVILEQNITKLKISEKEKKKLLQNVDSIPTLIEQNKIGGNL